MSNGKSKLAIQKKFFFKLIFHPFWGKQKARTLWDYDKT
jgi:hypothetical protein